MAEEAITTRLDDPSPLLRVRVLDGPLDYRHPRAVRWGIGCTALYNPSGHSIGFVRRSPRGSTHIAWYPEQRFAFEVESAAS